MSLAERLKEARDEKGWKKVELKRAAKLNSASTLTELENGSITESPQIPAIANALGVEAMWLKYGKGKKYVSDASHPPSQFGALAMRAAAAVNNMSSNEQIRLVHILEMQTIEAEHAEAINGDSVRQCSAGRVRNQAHHAHQS